MGWFRTIVGGALGFAITGGPLGAVLGAMAADAVFPGRARDRKPRITQSEQRQTLFFVGTFSMLAKLAQADGKVTRDEIDAIDAFMRDQLRLDDQTRAFAIDIFREAKESDHAFEEFATQFATTFARDSQVKEMLIDVLLRVSISDAELHQNEERMIESAADIFGFSRDDYLRMRARVIPDVIPYYRILGCAASDTDDAIRRRYRQLAKEYHPDNVIAKGMPEEFVELANRKFQDLQDAYDRVSVERGMR